jgi:phosphotriesterase-related protein
MVAGINVVMGTGYYIEATHPPEMANRDETELAEEMTREITDGVGDSGIRCGLIGEIGCETLSDGELKVLRAAARAQRATGALISVHTMFHYTGPEAGIRVARTLESAGANLSRVMFSHQDASGRDRDYQQEILKAGISLSYDTFGFEIPLLASGMLQIWPSDSERLEGIRWLCERGWSEQVLISQDVCVKCMLRKYGGWGFAHILEALPGIMSAAGVDRALRHTMMVENPKRLLPLSKN